MTGRDRERIEALLRVLERLRVEQQELQQGQLLVEYPRRIYQG